MRQSYRILPVYTGDVSGVCSALYELGGMVVMHDPSGCNSTYNTHDEIRWYDRDSLIFLSGLTEADAVMGGDDKFIADVADAADRYQPAFIALCNSPIPFLNGTDFDGIARQIHRAARASRPSASHPTACTTTCGARDLRWKRWPNRCLRAGADGPVPFAGAPPAAALTGAGLPQADPQRGR